MCESRGEIWAPFFFNKKRKKKRKKRQKTGISLHEIWHLQQVNAITYLSYLLRKPDLGDVLLHAALRDPTT